MIVGVILEKNLHDIANRVQNLPAGLDILELRLDFCEDLDIAKLAEIPFPLPVLFTLRQQNQGGQYKGNTADSLEIWKKLASLQPDYLDLEYDLDPLHIQEIAKLSTKSTIILSSHNFEGTPDNLEEILAKMQGILPKALFKIATKANSTLDALKMLAFSKKHAPKVIAICMGELGDSTRILAPVLGAGWSYCPVTQSSAPGQLTAQTLIETYKFKELHSTSKIYGLLGDPVAHSVGHIFHNQRNKNAVYVKWRITPAELAEAFALLKLINISGLSLTMPLKEHCLPLLGNIAESAKVIGAVNTIVVHENKWTGYNTDAEGAVRSLPIDIKDTTVLVIGAGGAARAIIHALAQKAAKVLVFNRSVEKAQKMLEDFQKSGEQTAIMQAYPLERLPELAQNDYHCIINTLPASVCQEFGEACFVSGKIALDITYSHDSTFLEKAKKAGCICIDGKKMFEEQALLQRELWGI